MYVHFTSQLKLIKPHSVGHVEKNSVEKNSVEKNSVEKNSVGTTGLNHPYISEPSRKTEEVCLEDGNNQTVCYSLCSVQHHSIRPTDSVPLPSGTSSSGGGLGHSQSAGSAQGSNSPSACVPAEVSTK